MWEHGGKEEVRLKGGAEMNTSYCRVPREREMTMACITVQGNCGDYKNYLASECISKVNPTLYFKGKAKYLI